VGNTSVFTWGDKKRTESNILNEIVYNQKFVPYFDNKKISL